jgi:hypothetical protein
LFLFISILLHSLKKKQVGSVLIEKKSHFFYPAMF